MDIKELWKPLLAPNNDYSVSNYGNVKSKYRRLKTPLNSSGYRQVCIRGCRFTISRLMAEVFLNHNPSKTKLVVDHIDENKQNDNLTNLRLIKHRENVARSKKRDLPTGVGLHSGKYRARIVVDGKQENLGRFSTIELAKEAYDKRLLTLK